MKQKLQHILFTLALAVFTPAGMMALHAQDANYSESGDTDTEAKTRPHYGPGGDVEPANSATLTSRTSAKDSVMVQPSFPASPSKGAVKPASDDDDSVLSFNFLYYIIRKYKLQDIMD